MSTEGKRSARSCDRGIRANSGCRPRLRSGDGSVSEQREPRFCIQPAMQIAEGSCTVRDHRLFVIWQLRRGAPQWGIPEDWVVTEAVLAGRLGRDLTFDTRFRFEEKLAASCHRERRDEPGVAWQRSRRNTIRTVKPLSSGSVTGARSASVTMSRGRSRRSGRISRTLFGFVVAMRSLARITGRGSDRRSPVVWRSGR